MIREVPKTSGIPCFGTSRMVYALTFSFSWKFYVFAAKEIQGVKGRWTFDTGRILW